MIALTYKLIFEYDNLRVYLKQNAFSSLGWWTAVDLIIWTIGDKWPGQFCFGWAFFSDCRYFIWIILDLVFANWLDFWNNCFFWIANINETIIFLWKLRMAFLLTFATSLKIWQTEKVPCLPGNLGAQRPIWRSDHLTISHTRWAQTFCALSEWGHIAHRRRNQQKSFGCTSLQ